jgi:hypothetical protein
MKPVFTAPSLRLLSRLFATLFMLVPLAHVHAGSVSGLVEKDWIEIDSPHFRVVTEQPEDAARRMIVDLENLRHISNRVRSAQSLDGPPLTIVAIGCPASGHSVYPRTWAAHSRCRATAMRRWPRSTTTPNRPTKIIFPGRRSCMSTTIS